MDSLEELTAVDRVLAFGVGGGGDVVGAVPTARFLEMHGVEVMLGGLAWERPEIDPRPGPRPFEEVTGIERVSATVGRVDGDTATGDGVTFAETHVARWSDREVLLLDVTRGAGALAEGLGEACGALGIDAVVGVDAGGDAVARGDEPGVRSPLADGLSLAALTALDRHTALGILGYGSDGELTRGELDARLAGVAEEGGLLGAWGITPATAAAMDALLETVPTEASRLPVAAARGAHGTREIRGGARALEVGPQSTVTYYLDPAVVAGRSGFVPLIRDADGLEEADRALRENGFASELPDEYGR